MFKPHYDYPVYWTIPDDGAKFRCVDCKELLPNTKVILAQSPDDKRILCCLDCIDEHWLASAKNLGEYPF